MEEEAGEAQHLEAGEVVEEVEVVVEVIQHSQVIWVVLVAKVQVQVEEAEGEGWGEEEVVAGVGETMSSADYMRCLLSSEVGCPYCLLMERAGLVRYSASSALSDCFWLSCFHHHRS